MYKLRDRETRIFWDLSLFLTLKRRFSERRHTKKGVESVARNNGKDHKSCQQCHGNHADGKVYVKQLLADFFQLFDGAQPLSVILQLFLLACYSRGQPAGCPLAFTVTWPF